MEFPFTTYSSNKIVYEEEYIGIYTDHEFTPNNLQVAVGFKEKENQFRIAIGDGCLMVDYIDIDNQNKVDLMNFYEEVKLLANTHPAAILY